MTATIKLTSPSPAEKAELIRRHFPALLPRFNPDTGNIECPSMTDPDMVHTITKRQLSVDTTVLVCDCKSTRQCTHLILAADIKPLGIVGQTVHIGMSDEDFNRQFGSLMQSRQTVGGIA